MLTPYPHYTTVLQSMSSLFCLRLSPSGQDADTSEGGTASSSHARCTVHTALCYRPATEAPQPESKPQRGPHARCTMHTALCYQVAAGGSPTPRPPRGAGAHLRRTQQSKPAERKKAGKRKRASQAASPFPVKRSRVPLRCKIILPQQPEVVNTFFAPPQPEVYRDFPASPRARLPPCRSPRGSPHLAQRTTLPAPHRKHYQSPEALSLRTLPKM